MAKSNFKVALNHANRVIDETRKMEALKLSIENEKIIKEEKKKAEFDRQKSKIYAWRVCPEAYSMEYGVVFANSYEEAIAIVKSRYPNAISHNVTNIDYNDDIFVIGQYWE